MNIAKEVFDPIIGKSLGLLRPFRTPAFYAGKQLAGAYGSPGRITINHKIELLDKDWKKIPGLYTVGTDA